MLILGSSMKNWLPGGTGILPECKVISVTTGVGRDLSPSGTLKDVLQ